MPVFFRLTNRVFIVFSESSEKQICRPKKRSTKFSFFFFETPHRKISAHDTVSSTNFQLPGHKIKQIQLRSAFEVRIILSPSAPTYTNFEGRALKNAIFEGRALKNAVSAKNAETALTRLFFENPPHFLRKSRSANDLAERKKICVN